MQRIRVRGLGYSQRVKVVNGSPQRTSAENSYTVVGGGYEDFDGAYEYDPLITAQIVPCADKHMLDDLTFNMIQTRETTLPSGGVLFEILG